MGVAHGKRLLATAVAVAWVCAVAAGLLCAPPDSCAAERRRIVSLAPSVTETLFALGAGPDVVGVSTYCDYPAEASKLPKVGNFLTPNVEAIMALRPTLVVGLRISSNQRELSAVEATGCPVLLVGEETLAEIRESIRLVGDRIGRSKEADALLARLDSRLDAIRERLKAARAPRVLMLVGHQPMVAVGRGTFLDELLAMANAVNIADNAGQPWPRLSMEYVIAMAPDVIIDGQMGSEVAEPGGFWAQYPTIPAVRNHRVYGYRQDPVLRPGPRVWQSLEIIASLIHPGLMAGWRGPGGPAAFAAGEIASRPERRGDSVFARGAAR